MKKFNMVLKLAYGLPDLLAHRIAPQCAAPFPVPADNRGYPTRVAFVMFDYRQRMIYKWEGKPTIQAIARLRRLSQTRNVHRIRACEYDRKYVIATMDIAQYGRGHMGMFPVRMAVQAVDYHPWANREHGFFGVFAAGHITCRVNGSKMGFYAPTLEQGQGYARQLLRGIVDRGMKVI